MNSKTFTFIFFVVLAIEIYVLQFLPHMRFISKPLIMISIIMYFLLSTKSNFGDHKLMAVGFVFALIGDVLLLRSGMIFFKLGILAFMITHICYLFAFMKQREIGMHKHLLFIVVFTMIPVCFNLFFWNYLGDLAIPVLLYSFVISATVIGAKMRWNLKGYWFVLIGILLFMISDFSIAIQKFYFAFDYADAFVMLTYAIGQYLIIRGYLMGYKLERI